MKKSNLCIIQDQQRPIPPVVTANLSGKTVVVVGANTGLGLATAKHFANMGPERLVLGCRDKQRGENALKDLEEETGYTKAELLLVDLARSGSMKNFVETLNRFERLDILVLNAGVMPSIYTASEDGWEMTLQVNVLGTTYLALSLLPLMNKTAENFQDASPRLVAVSSFVHYMAKMDRKVVLDENKGILEALSDKAYSEKNGKMGGRYYESKLIGLAFMRALATHTSPNPKTLIICPNPGWCDTEIRRDMGLGALTTKLNDMLARKLAYTPEEGARQFVWAALGGKTGPSAAEPKGVYTDEQLHGAYTNISKVDEVSDYLLGEEGKKMEARIWAETIGILAAADDRIPEIVRSLKYAP